MMAGRRVLEALIVYCKIDVVQTLNEIRTSKKKNSEQEEEEKCEEVLEFNQAYKGINLKEL
jgi:hypothetical protein